MGNDAAEARHILQKSSGGQVHSSMCQELIKILDKVLDVLPFIESAQPGGRSGIEELCALNNSIDKAKLLLQHCAESSKLYLAITGGSVLLRCERIRNGFYESLSQIQDMVPLLLASQIAEILNYIRNARFSIDPKEGYAGRVMLELLGQKESTNDFELAAFQKAASTLNISSNKAFLIERRSIKKLLDDIYNNDSKKEKVLKYILYLIKKYGKLVSDSYEQRLSINLDSENTASCTTSACEGINPGIHQIKPDGTPNKSDAGHTDAPPDEFLCPISSQLMRDPVVIASGQTYERIWIEKWFNEGHDTCPKTRKKLDNFAIVPNSCMKDLISSWCRKHGLSFQETRKQRKYAMLGSWEPSHCNSISSLKNVNASVLSCRTDYMLQSDQSNVSFASSDLSSCSYLSHVSVSEGSKDDYTSIFSWNDDYHKYSSFSDFSEDMFLKFFTKLSELPSKTQGKALDELKEITEDADTCNTATLNVFVKTLLTFLSRAYIHSDVPSQRIGGQVLLNIVGNIRVQNLALDKEAVELLASLLMSGVAMEALLFIQMLLTCPSFVSSLPASGIVLSIEEILSTEDTRLLEVVVKTLCLMSSLVELRPRILDSGCIPKIVPLLSGIKLAENCIKILQNLSEIEAARMMIVQMDGCLSSIVELLETGNQEEQEHAVAVLHSLCSSSLDNCKMVMNEGVIPPLVSISLNGTPQGREWSLKLLHILRDIWNADDFECLKLSDSSDHHESLQSQLEPSEYFENSRSRSDPTPGTIELYNKHSTKGKPRPSSSNFFSRKMKFFSKPRTLAMF